MRCVKCMNSCCCYISLKLGAYIICFTFMLVSVTLSVLTFVHLTKHYHLDSKNFKGLLVILAIAYGVLSFSSCCLLYGLCTEKKWPLIAFILVAVIVAIDELAIIVYLIVNRDKLPTTAIAVAATQTLILVAVVFSIVVIFSLYMQWQEDVNGGRRLSGAFN